MDESVCSISIHRLPAISKFFSNLQLLDVGANHRRGTPHAYPPPSQPSMFNPSGAPSHPSLFTYSCVYLLFYRLRLSWREEASSRENSHQFIKARSLPLSPSSPICLYLYLCLKGPTSTQTNCHSSVTPSSFYPTFFCLSSHCFHSPFTYSLEGNTQFC